MKCFPRGQKPFSDGSVLKMSHWSWEKADQRTAKSCCWCKSVQGVMTIWVKKWRTYFSPIQFYSPKATLKIKQKLSQEVYSAVPIQNKIDMMLLNKTFLFPTFSSAVSVSQSIQPTFRKGIISSGVGHSCFVPYHLWSTILLQRDKPSPLQAMGCILAVSSLSSCRIYEGLGFCTLMW